MSIDDHLALVEALQGVSGMVILSGYDNDLYNDTLSGWMKDTKECATDGVRRMMECLWLSPRTVDALKRVRPTYLPLTHLAPFENAISISTDY
jgi:DNA adenine methylase